MRATLNIPDNLMVKVQKITGEKSKTRAIITAMDQFVREKKINKLLKMKGNVKIDYDWKKEEDEEMMSENEEKKQYE